MKLKIIYILNILAILFAAAVIVYQLCFAEEKNIKTIIKAAGILLVYLLAVTGVRRKRSPFDYVVYQELYREIIGNAFSSDKGSYKKLMTAINHYNGNKQEKAIAVLDKLYGACVDTDDFVAVLFFKALCLSELNRLDETVKCYEEILMHKRSFAKAWSNLGTIYQRLGRAEDSYRAYREAVTYNPGHAAAYNNIAAYFVNKAEAEPALENALKAIELDSRLYQAMGAAAMAYKMMGDYENAEKYCRMYGVNGGNASELHSSLERI